MAIIYEPAGKAREYSPYALNIYLACTHKCAYCYAPRCRHQNEEEYFTAPMPRAGLLEKLSEELKRNAPKEQVLLSFIGDPYCEALDSCRTTRACLELLLEHEVPTAVLTKGGRRCLKDMDLFRRFGPHIQIGATLTFDDEKKSMEWEPGAASPGERLETLRELKRNGVRTFASFEPVIEPEESLKQMERGLDCIDVYKVGKLNNYKGLDKAINWTEFLTKTVRLLRGAGKEFYVKYDLRMAARTVSLTPEESSADVHNVTW